MPPYTPTEVKHLESMPTIHSSQCCNCKIDTGDTRVWVCRVGGGVTVEQLIGGRWEIIEGSCTSQ